MEATQGLRRMGERASRLARVALTIVLATTVLAGCAVGTTQPAEPQDDASANAEAFEYDTYVPEGEPRINFARECHDRRGDVTAYAVAELNGWQLQTLLLEQGYVWSAQDLTWVKDDGSAALVVRAADGTYLDDRQIAKLGLGSEEAVSYRMVTSAYSSARRTFDALADNVLTCEDKELVDDGAVAVASGPSGHRMLLLVHKSNDVWVLSVFGEPAVEAGLLDEVCGQEVGTTVDEAFEALAGRAPEAL